MSMAHRGALSPRRHGAGTNSSSSSASSRMGVGIGVSDTEPPFLPDQYETSSAVHTRTRMTSSYVVFVTMEGLLSLVALWSSWAMASPVITMQGGASASPSPLHRAARSGAALGLGMPFFLLATRLATLALGRLRTSGSEAQLQQPRLGFPLPPGVDENAALDMYAIGVGAAMLGVFVPSLEVCGNLLGRVLRGASAVWCLLALVVVPAAVYLALGAWFEVCSPGEGFWVGTRPTKAMWGFCGIGHVVFVSACFYSPDVTRALGFLLGLVHMVRFLQQVFAFPAAGGTGTCDDGGVGVAEL